MKRWIARLAALGILGGMMVPVALAQNAETLYKTKCAACHGADGKAQTFMGKKLNIRPFDSAETKKMSDAGLMTILEKGKNKMPAYAGKLTGAEIDSLVGYVRELGKK